MSGVAKQVLLSYGGGMDSTALIAMDQHRAAAAAYLGISRADLDAALPRFDKAVFSDPGAEFSVTYRTIERVKQALGDRLVITRKAGESIAVGLLSVLQASWSTESQLTGRWSG